MPSGNDAPERGIHARPTPTDREAWFGPDERFFSTTDERGRIRSGNAVFQRTSGHPYSVMVGAPHNLIRHPDMPRAAYRLMWQRLQAGEPFVAYVKNLAADGAYYWVTAFVVPAPDGYLSIRIKPTTALFAVTRGIYAEMLALEAAAENGTREGREQGISAATACLLRRLAEAGFDGYTAFQQAVLVAELAAQPATLRATTMVGGTPLAAVGAACADLDHLLSGLLDEARASADLHEIIGSRAQFILGLSQRMRTFAINALLAAGRLNAAGAALAAIAELMRDCSDGIGAVIARLDAEFSAALGELAVLSFRAAAGRLQIDMARDFVDELATSEHDDQVLGEDLAVLVACLGDGVDGLLSAQAAVTRRTHTILGELQQLDGLLRRLKSLESSGRVETARLTGTDNALGVLFAAIAEQVMLARGELDGVRAATLGLGAADAAAGTSARRQIEVLRQLVAIEPARV
ncbi:MAG TPA: PAS domain S-box protein [Egicoccus sp.]|nr:PAS domain S-box protein [Egicoccus sp.]HSK21890.1 PAS domain S-box protein [Egicoccus sp.]